MAKKKTKKKKAKAKRTGARRSSGGTAVVAVRRGKKKTKRKLGAALKRPVQPDKKLASIIGGKKVQYSEILRKVWAYVKRNGLNSGRTIRLDSKLKNSGIWGSKSKITMFEVGKAMKHTVKK